MAFINFYINEQNPGLMSRGFSIRNQFSLEQVPEELVVDLVVILHFGRFDERPE